MNSSEILIIFPGHLEALTTRGGGREDRLLKVAKELSKYYGIVIAAPFFGVYQKKIKVSPRLMIDSLFFPSSPVYPPKSQFTKFMQVFSLVFYSYEAIFKMIQLKKEGLRVVLLSDFISGFIPGIAAKVLSLKVLCYEGNITPWCEPSFTPRGSSLPQSILSNFICLCAKITSKKSAAIIVNDGLIKNGLVKLGIDEGKIYIIRGMVDVEAFNSLNNNSTNDDEFIIGFNGRLNQEKGAHILLDLCKTSLDELPWVRFIILGDGQFKERLQVLPNVKYVGRVAHSKLCSSLSSVNAVVTFQKTFGMGEVEALSCGKPLIASNVGEMGLLMEHKGIGLLCEPTVSAYIESIKALSQDKSLLDKLSKRSRMHAVESYNLEIVCDRWRTVFNNIWEA